MTTTAHVTAAEKPEWKGVQTEVIFEFSVPLGRYPSGFVVFVGLGELAIRPALLFTMHWCSRHKVRESKRDLSDSEDRHDGERTYVLSWSYRL